MNMKRLWTINVFLVTAMIISLSFTGCWFHRSPRDAANQIVDPVTKVWQSTEGALVTMHEAGQIDATEWHAISQTRDKISVKMRQLWDLELKVSNGQATVGELQTLIDQIKTEMLPLATKAGVAL